MWAQLIKSRVRPGKEEEARGLPQEMESRYGRNTAWNRMMAFENQKDPSERYTLFVFDNEEKAREQERSPEQAERVQRLGEIFEKPEFVDLSVVFERQS